MTEKDAQAVRSDQPTDEGIKVSDKRRITLDGEAAPGEANEETATESSAIPEEFLTKLKEAEARRDEAEREKSDLVDRFRKAQVQLRAENDELRARLQRNFEQKLEAARGDMVAGLLDVLDNLKLAVAAGEASQGKAPEFDNLLGGVRATAQIFEAKLAAMGLTPVAGRGEVFNPEIHEAVELVPAAPEQDGRVVEELQTGYRFGDRLLRPARVRVGRADEK